MEFLEPFGAIPVGERIVIDVTPQAGGVTCGTDICLLHQLNLYVAERTQGSYRVVAMCRSRAKTRRFD